MIIAFSIFYGSDIRHDYKFRNDENTFVFRIIDFEINEKTKIGTKFAWCIIKKYSIYPEVIENYSNKLIDAKDVPITQEVIEKVKEHIKSNLCIII